MIWRKLVSSNDFALINGLGSLFVQADYDEKGHELPSRTREVSQALDVARVFAIGHFQLLLIVKLVQGAMAQIVCKTNLFKPRGLLRVQRTECASPGHCSLPRRLIIHPSLIPSVDQ